MTRKKKPTTSLVRSSAAEYLTFVAASGTGGVEAVYADENVWLSQKMMAQLYDVDVRTINYHLKTIFTDSELEEDAVIRSFRITAADGKTYDTKHYNLSAIIAVGYKVNSERAVQFRKWATRVVEEFTIKGFAMDDERLKRGGSVLSDRYFEEQLQRVREIRLSERKFYQKVTDIYATSVVLTLPARRSSRFESRPRGGRYRKTSAASSSRGVRAISPTACPTCLESHGVSITHATLASRSTSSPGSSLLRRMRKRLTISSECSAVVRNGRSSIAKWIFGSRAKRPCGRLRRIREQTGPYAALALERREFICASDRTTSATTAPPAPNVNSVSPPRALAAAPPVAPDKHLYRAGRPKGSTPGSRHRDAPFVCPACGAEARAQEA
jgi:hypothetical protein